MYHHYYLQRPDIGIPHVKIGIISKKQWKVADFYKRKLDSNIGNCIIILTSNVGATTIRKQNRLGFGMVDEKTAQKDEYEKMKETIMVEVKKQFRPEFLNRIDDIVVFHSLTKEDISSIVILMCKDLKNRLKDLDINLEMKQDAIDLIAKDGIDLEYGARPLKRSIQNNLENELSELILQQVIKAGDDVVADVKDDKMIFTVQ